MKNILNKVQPPDSTCEKELNCGSCITRPDCIWSTDRRACFVGKFFDYLGIHCIKNTSKIKKTLFSFDFIFIIHQDQSLMDASLISASFSQEIIV